MGKINVLDTAVANLIAAGEVVDRPASVIKELMENAVDAGASRITVEIQRGGVRYMRVTDDGCGIGREDVPVALKRHATSKIRTARDLDAIGTLGFRGEALAAISAVSKVRIMTKRREDQTGTLLLAEGGTVKSVSDCGCPDGTTVIAEELFYNVPARLKFLKKDAAETTAVVSLVEKMALSHPEIAVKLICDGTPRFTTAGDSQLKNAIYAVLGRDFAQKTIWVQGGYDGVELEGFIGTPENVRANRNFQIFFINQRYIRSKTMSAALEQAFTSFLPTEKFPSAVLFLRLHPSLVDVNVHPAKLEVKFSNEKLIFECVYYAVRNALQNTTSRPVFSLSEKSRRNQIAHDVISAQAPLPEGKNSGETTVSVQKMRMDLDQSYAHSDDPTASLREAPCRQAMESREMPPLPWEEPMRPGANAGQSSQPTRQTGESESVTDPAAFAQAQDASGAVCKPEESTVSAVPGETADGKAGVHLSSDQALARASETSARTQAAQGGTESAAEPSASGLPRYRIAGELFRCYVLVELDDRCLIIDKHAAHERILFEELKKNLYSREPYGQILFVPLVVTLDPAEAAAVMEEKASLEKIGYAFELKGDQAYLMQIPSAFDADNAVDAFVQIADQLAQGTGDTQISAALRMEKALYSGACKAAVKAGRIYSDEHIDWIVQRLLALPDIKYCPHGRPVCFEMTKSAIENRFLRS